MVLLRNAVDDEQTNALQRLVGRSQVIEWSCQDGIRKSAACILNFNAHLLLFGLDHHSDLT